MKYYIILDNENNVIGLHATSNFDTKLTNTIEISQDDYNLLKFYEYRYKYENGSIVNLGKVPEAENDIPIEQKVLDGINLLIELQADMIGGAI